MNESNTVSLAGQSSLWPSSVSLRIPCLPQHFIKALRESQTTQTAAQVFKCPLFNQFLALSVHFQGAADALVYHLIQLALMLSSTLQIQDESTYLF